MRKTVTHIRRWTLTATLIGFTVLTACTSQPEAEPVATAGPEPRVRVVETVPMYMDRLYPSMSGPYQVLAVDVSDMEWITGIKTEVVDALTDEYMGSEFMCHSQLQIPSGVRIVVTATGFEQVRFPPGFGIPVRQLLDSFPQESRSIAFLGMLLNNHDPDINRYGKMRATVEYFTREDVADEPLKKLYVVGAPINVENIEAWTPPEGVEIPEDVTTHCALVDGLTNHWIVPPGPQKTRTRYDDLVPVDATVHFVAVHLHNYGRYMRLTDATTGEILWQADVEYEEDRAQIKKIPVYSSAEGFPIYADHEYDLEAFYDNTSDHDTDAMAMIYVYYHPNRDEDIVYPTELQGTRGS